MNQNYQININAPQAQRIYKWQQKNNNWFIVNEYCSNCHSNLKSKLALSKFCPNCGFRIVNTQNPKPPEEV